MTTIYRNSNLTTLNRIARHLKSKGFTVGQIVVPENPWTDGNPYFATSAQNSDIYSALKATR